MLACSPQLVRYGMRCWRWYRGRRCRTRTTRSPSPAVRRSGWTRAPTASNKWRHGSSRSARGARTHAQRTDRDRRAIDAQSSQTTWPARRRTGRRGRGHSNRPGRYRDVRTGRPPRLDHAVDAVEMASPPSSSSASTWQARWARAATRAIVSVQLGHHCDVCRRLRCGAWRERTSSACVRGRAGVTEDRHRELLRASLEAAHECRLGPGVPPARMPPEAPRPIASTRPYT